jgi:putative transposase
MAEIRRQLAYKTAWCNGTLIHAPTLHPSSKTCSSCAAVKANLPLGARTYQCEHCGLSIDRDLNAAINLAKLAETMVDGSWPGDPKRAVAPPRRTENPCKTRPRRAVGRPRIRQPQRARDRNRHRAIGGCVKTDTDISRNGVAALLVVMDWSAGA